MGSPHDRGELARRRILVELKRREAAHERPATLNALRVMPGLSGAQHHLAILVELGLVTAEHRRAGYFLTPKGRMLASRLLKQVE